MGSPGSREAILKAQENIERHVQYCDQHKSSEPGGTRNTSPIWTQEINNGDTDLIVQFHDHAEFRGAVNAMIHLIDVHGIEELQRVGIVGHGSGPHVRGMALAAGVYNIPVYPENSTPGTLDHAVGAEPMSPLDLRRLEIDPSRYDAPESPKAARRSQPIPFPSVEDVESVHGQGTVAFELEREFATRGSTSSQQEARKSRPDIVISDLDVGIALSGICMAFASTGTHVFGAAPSEGFWDHAWSLHTPGAVPTHQDKGYRYWAGTKHPMSAVPWRTFTAPGYLSGIYEVNNEQVHAASIMARDHYQRKLHPDEAVPLAVALYNEEFQRFASKGAKRGHKRVIGVILRSQKEYH